MPNLYNLRLLAPNHYAMAKFDADFNVAAVYNLTTKGFGFTCDCPASARAIKTKPCKHQRMMRVMMGAVNTERFYDPETGHWHAPLAAFRNGDSDGLAEADFTANADGASAKMIPECVEDTSTSSPELPAPVTSVAPQAVGARGAGPSRQPPAQTPVVTRRI